MSDAFIDREARHARAMCRVHLRELVATTRRDLGLPSKEQEQRERLQQHFKDLSLALSNMGAQIRKAMAALPKQEDYTRVVG